MDGTRFDFTLRAGTTATLQVPVFDATKAPVLEATLRSGWKAVAAVVAPGGGAPLQAWSTVAGGAIVGTIDWASTAAIPAGSPLGTAPVTTGQALVQIPKAMSLGWVPVWSVGEYTVDVIDPAGEPATLLWGVIRLETDAAATLL